MLMAAAPSVKLFTPNLVPLPNIELAAHQGMSHIVYSEPEWAILLQHISSTIVNKPFQPSLLT